MVADGEGGTDTATITVTVTGVNDPPVALGPIAPVSGADSVSVTPIDTSVAFSNPNHLPLTYTATNLPAGLVIDPATGVIAGTPAHDASVQGPYVVTVTATAPTGATSSTLLQINVANPGPTSVADNAATPAGTPVVIVPLANDSDPNGDPLSISSFTTPLYGSVFQSGSNLVYQSITNYCGPDSFNYTITDNHGGFSSNATVSVTVTNCGATNQNPVANPDPPPVAGKVKRERCCEEFSREGFFLAGLGLDHTPRAFSRRGAFQQIGRKQIDFGGQNGHWIGSLYTQHSPVRAQRCG